jgi:hypothetical protein
MGITADAVAVEVIYHLLDIAGCYADGGIGCPIIKPDGTMILLQDPTTREHYVRHVATALIRGLRPEHPFVASHQHEARIVAVKHGQS